MSTWQIEADAEDGGSIVHTALPRFRARWITGDDDEHIAALAGPVWSDPGSGSGEDDIHLYAFEWSSGVPDQESFEALMRDAVRAVETWITGRL